MHMLVLLSARLPQATRHSISCLCFPALTFAFHYCPWCSSKKSVLFLYCRMSSNSTALTRPLQSLKPSMAAATAAAVAT
eukprot:6206157-Pleurochrysis_carterae.AAC.1